MPTPSQASPRPRRPRAWWIASGLAVGLLAGWWVAGRSAPPLTAESLAAGAARWRERAPASYRLEIETGGPAGARQEIEVRDGEVVRMTTGGAEAARSAWSSWTVEALFDVLEAELTNAAAAQRTYGAPPGSVVLKATFDRRWGYPAYFLRHVLGRRNSVEWHVVEFEPR